VKISELVQKAHDNAVKKGFWDEPRETGTMLALIHSEVSEALEADRHGDRENFAEELADTVIRICDLCGGMEIDLEKAIVGRWLLTRPGPISMVRRTEGG
jgi:NTP pyrophosphatase (non-canonical NTP hydrolase)